MSFKISGTQAFKVITFTVATSLLAACSSSSDNANDENTPDTNPVVTSAITDSNPTGETTSETTNEETDGSSLSDNGADPTTGDNMNNMPEESDGDTDNSAITAPTLDLQLLDNGTGALYSQAVNSALLSGSVIGSGEVLNDTLYKSIQFTTVNSPADIEILHAIVIENGIGSERAVLNLYVRNASNEIRCFVQYGSIEVYDAAGQNTASGFDSGFVDGTSGTGDTIYAHNCISPGEIVYLFSALEPHISLDQIASVKIFDMQSTNSRLDSGLSDLVVKPISYESYELNDKNSNLTFINVRVANQSSQTVQLFTSRLIAMTDDGIPIHIALGNLQAVSVIQGEFLQPGAETVISYPDFFKGNSTNIRVSLNYQPVE